MYTLHVNEFLENDQFPPYVRDTVSRVKGFLPELKDTLIPNVSLSVHIQESFFDKRIHQITFIFDCYSRSNYVVLDIYITKTEKGISGTICVPYKFMTDSLEDYKEKAIENPQILAYNLYLIANYLLIKNGLKIR